MKRFLTFNLLILASHLALADSGRGTLEGKAYIKISEKRTPASRQTIQLSVIRDDFTIAQARTTTSSSGAYRFTDLDRSSAYSYGIELLNNGVPFTSTTYRFENSSTIHVADLEATAVTSALKDVTVDEIVLVEIGKANMLKLAHSIVAQNNGSTTYDFRAMPANPIQIQLPEGGFELNLGPGAPQNDVQIDDKKNTLLWNAHIEPGQKRAQRIEFSYLVPYSTRSLPIRLRSNLNRGRMTVAVVEKPVRIQSTALSFSQTREKDGKPYYLYTGGQIAADSDFSFTLEDLPLSSDLGHRMALIGIAVTFLLVIFLATRKRVAAPEIDRNTLKAKLLEELRTLENAKPQDVTEAEKNRLEQERIREWLFDIQHDTQYSNR